MSGRTVIADSVALANRPWQNGTRLMAFAAVAAAAIGGLMIGRVPLFALVVGGAASLVLFFFLAWARPLWALLVVATAVALVPMYAIPNFQAFSPQPTAGAAGVLALALWLKGGTRFRPTSTDLAFGLMVLGVLLAAVLGPQRLFGTLAMLLLWVPMYLGGRFAGAREFGAREVAVAMAVLGLVATPFVLIEAAMETSPFFSLSTSSSQFAELWDHADPRAGGLYRTEGAFGHPLTMAVIVSVSASMAIALAVATKGWQRMVWAAIGVGCIAAQATSDQRSGWVVLAASLGLFVLAAAPRGARLRRVSVLMMAVVPIVAVTYGLSRPDQPTSRAFSETREASTQYRRDLYAHALDPGAFAVLGFKSTATYASAVIPGADAIDAAYLQTGAAFGLITLFPMLLVVGTVARAFWRTAGQWLVIVPAATLGLFIAITFVGFQTQIPLIVWFMAGATSGVTSRVGAAQRGGLRSPVSGAA